MCNTQFIQLTQLCRRDFKAKMLKKNCVHWNVNEGKNEIFLSFHKIPSISSTANANLYTV